MGVADYFIRDHIAISNINSVLIYIALA